MRNRQWVYKLGLSLTFILTGLPYWLTPYHKVELLDWFFPTIWAVTTLIFAAIVQNWVNQKPSTTIFWISGGAPLAVLARIMFDTLLIDPTSHNLFPFEIGIAYSVSLVSAAIGAYLSSIIWKQSK